MKTVLVVDDDVDTTDLYSIILMGAGYKVIVAHSIQKAVELAYTHRVDVLLTDLYLGDGLGSELPHLMGKRTPKSTVLITGRDPYPAKQHQGFDDYLLKPVDCDLLCKTIGNAALLLEDVA